MGGCVHPASCRSQLTPLWRKRSANLHSFFVEWWGESSAFLWAALTNGVTDWHPLIAPMWAGVSSAPTGPCWHQVGVHGGLSPTNLLQHMGNGSSAPCMTPQTPGDDNQPHYPLLHFTSIMLDEGRGTVLHLNLLRPGVGENSVLARPHLHGLIWSDWYWTGVGAQLAGLFPSPCPTPPLWWGIRASPASAWCGMKVQLPLSTAAFTL